MSSLFCVIFFKLAIYEAAFFPFVQRLPAELSFEQITAHSSTDKVREVFAAAFQAVEEAFLESIDHCIAERTQLLDKIPEDMPQLEAAHKFPDTLARLQVCTFSPNILLLIITIVFLNGDCKKEAWIIFNIMIGLGFLAVDI